MKKSIYLDFAAATPVDPRVEKIMKPYYSEQYYNPSAIYQAGRKIKKDLAESRKKIAKVLAIQPMEVVFTAGGTEANNLCIRGIMQKYPGKKLLVSAIEHESVSLVAEQYRNDIIAVNSFGEIDLDDLRSKLSDDVVLVSSILASNELGTILDIRSMAKIIDAARKDRQKRRILTPIFFHTDATQAAPYIKLFPKRFGLDLMSINGGKIYGPKQSGMAFVRTGIELEPIIYGGGQEKGLRSGTENVASCIGFAEALSIGQATAESEAKKLTILRDELKKNLSELIKNIVFHGHPTKRLPNHLSFAIPEHDGERLAMELDERGIMVGIGSACSASKAEISKALAAVGISDELSQATLRITLGRKTTKSDIDMFTTALTNILVNGQ